MRLLSALARRRREEPGAARRLLAARREVLSAWERWSEVTAIEVVRRHAERLLESHPIGAANALQIGAALVMAGDDLGSVEFVTFDRIPAVAAEREGLRVLGPE